MATAPAAVARRCGLAILAASAAFVAGASLGGQEAILLQAADLTHVGTFRLPRPSGAGFSYGGTALAFNPANNSLFITTADQLTAEVSIPPIGETASIIQPITDSLNGKLTKLGSAPGGQKIGGHLIWGDTLITTGFLYYDADHAQKVSHFTRPTNLSTGTATEPVSAGQMNPGFYSGYMAPIPPEWQAPLGGPALTGNCCLSIVSRTSFGPAVASFNPSRIGASNPLIYYNVDHPTLGKYGDPKPNLAFNGTTKIRGLVFPEGTASVLFFGTTGIGKWCYGEASECGDPVYPYKGDHAYPYRPYVWAYDARDLAAVKTGKKRPWQVVPYATWDLSSTIGEVSLDQIGGAAYDPATGRLFLSSRGADGGDNPLIHVYLIGRVPRRPPG
jgi:hypothetical protein